VDATKALLARIEKLNPKLNAFTLVDEKVAMNCAKASEAKWQAHRKAALHGGAEVGALEGVPASIKDLILTRGWPTLRGSRTVDPNQAWEVDAPVTARLRESGAVLFAKTTTPEFGCKGETNSPATGITRNPWNTDKTPGGSSGGTAAAVAAGLGPIGVGTDGAGSVRIPAAFCGNFGLKPSFGRGAHTGSFLRQLWFEAQLWPCACLPTFTFWFGGAFGPPHHERARCCAHDECDEAARCA